MTIAQRKLLIAVLALFCSAAVIAADAPKAEPAKDAKADHKDDKKDEKKDGKDAKDAKADAPAEPELPSKPYPANATPKAFQPKKDPPKADAGGDKSADKSADKAAAKPGADKASDKHSAEKTAEKPSDKPADKHAADKHGDKPADAHTAATHKAEPAPRKVVKKNRAAHNAQAKANPPVASPAMQDLAREMAGRQPTAGAQSYVVQARDNLDTVIRKTLPGKLFSDDVLRQAYLRANPALMAAASVKLRPGQVLQVPDVSTLRAVIMGDGDNGRDARISLHSTAPVVAPTIAPTAYDQNPPIAVPRLPVNVAASANPAPEVSPEEKKKWVRYP